MVASAADITAVLDYLYNERMVDIQGLLNQDNPDLVGRQYPVNAFSLAKQAVITLTNAADIDNFKVNEVIKFFKVTDAPFALNLTDLVLEELRIIEITGATLTLNLDSLAFTGTFGAGYIVNTYKSRIMQHAAKRGISRFKQKTGINFINTSEEHLDYVGLAALAFLFGRASAEYRNMTQELDKLDERYRTFKGDFSQGSDFGIDEDDYYFQGSGYKRDLGLD